jgi:hypothetical protein
MSNSDETEKLSYPLGVDTSNSHHSDEDGDDSHINDSVITEKYSSQLNVSNYHHSDETAKCSTLCDFDTSNSHHSSKKDEEDSLSVLIIEGTPSLVEPVNCDITLDEINASSSNDSVLEKNILVNTNEENSFISVGCLCSERVELHSRNNVSLDLYSNVKLADETDLKLKNSSEKKTILLELKPSPKRRYLCPDLTFEYSWNNMDMKFYHNGDEKTKMQKCRKRISEIEILISCEFLLSNSVKLRLCLMREVNIDINDRLIIILSSRVNQVQFPALVFLKHCIQEIDRKIERANIVGYEGKWKKLHGDYINIEVVNELEEGLYIIIRDMFDSYHVLDRLVMSGSSWGELKKIEPMLNLCYDNYYASIDSDKAKSTKIPDLIFSPIIPRKKAKH